MRGKSKVRKKCLALCSNTDVSRVKMLHRKMPRSLTIETLYIPRSEKKNVNVEGNGTSVVETNFRKSNQFL